MRLRILLSFLPLFAAATLRAGGFAEDFGKAPFNIDETVVGVNGWTIRSASPEFGNEAASIRSGGPNGAGQSLEVIAKADATFVRNVQTPPLEVSASKNNRISVDLLYENAQDFRGGVIYLAIATNAGSLNIGLTSGEPGSTGIAFIDLGSSEQRVNSPAGTFKPGTWYRFTVDLYQGGGRQSAKVALVPIQADAEAKPVWETVIEMDRFAPTAIERFDISVARTGRSPVIRVARFGGISVATTP